MIEYFVLGLLLLVAITIVLFFMASIIDEFRKDWKKASRVTLILVGLVWLIILLGYVAKTYLSLSIY